MKNCRKICIKSTRKKNTKKKKKKKKSKVKTKKKLRKDYQNYKCKKYKENEIKSHTFCKWTAFLRQTKEKFYYSCCCAEWEWATF